MQCNRKKDIRVYQSFSENFFEHTSFLLVAWPASTPQHSEGMGKELEDLDVCSEYSQ